MNGHLPPLAPRAFEVAARLMSFKATDELKVDTGRDQPPGPRARTGFGVKLFQRPVVGLTHYPTPEPFGCVDAVGPDAAAEAELVH